MTDADKIQKLKVHETDLLEQRFRASRDARVS